MPRRDGVRPTNAKDNVRPEDDMGHSVAGACLEEPAVLTAFPSLLHPQDPPQQRDRILFVTAELSDFVKVGGLGDFSAALPRVLKREHSVRVLLPA